MVKIYSVIDPKRLRTILQNGGLWVADINHFSFANAENEVFHHDEKLQEALQSYAYNGIECVLFESTYFNPGGTFGRKGRFIEKAHFCDEIGIKFTCKILSTYDDDSGVHFFKSLEKVWERDERVTKEGLELKVQREVWFRENEEKIAVVLDYLNNLAKEVFTLETGDRYSPYTPFHKKQHDSLKAGQNIKDSVLEDFLKEAIRQKSPPFDLNLKEFDLVIKNVKVDNSPYGQILKIIGYNEMYKETIIVKMGAGTGKEVKLCKMLNTPFEKKELEYVLIILEDENSTQNLYIDKKQVEGSYDKGEDFRITFFEENFKNPHFEKLLSFLKVGDEIKINPSTVNERGFSRYEGLIKCKVKHLSKEEIILTSLDFKEHKEYLPLQEAKASVIGKTIRILGGKIKKWNNLIFVSSPKF